MAETLEERKARVERENAVNSAPAASTTARSGRDPIGVPAAQPDERIASPFPGHEGFVTQRGTPAGFTRQTRVSVGPFRGSGTEFVEARYFEGDELNVASWDTNRTAQWQSAMAQIGLLSGKYSYGAPDDKTIAAYSKVLAIANRLGVTDEEALMISLNNNAKYDSGSGGGGGGGAGRAPLQVRLSNPEDLKEAFSQVSKKLTGQGAGFDEDTLNRMVAAYQQTERQFQQSAYDGNTTITEPQSFETFAEDFVDETQPGGVAAKKYADAAAAMMQMM